MKLSQKLGFISTVAAALLFSGCGEGGSSTTPSDAVSTAAKVITVERGPLLDANVTDAKGRVAVEIGEGRYAFEDEPQYPVTARGGYIDVNRDGEINAGEVKNELELRTESGDVVTLATTLASDEVKKEILQEQFELTQEQIQTQTPSESTDIEAFSNVVYEYAINHDYKDLSEIPADELETLVNDYKAQRDEYKTDGHTVAEHEQAVVNTLSVVTLDDAEAQQAQQEQEERLQKAQETHKELFNNFSADAQDVHSSVADAVDDAKADAQDAHSSVADAVNDAKADAQDAHSNVADSIVQSGFASYSSQAHETQAQKTAQEQSQYYSSQAQDVAEEEAQSSSEAVQDVAEEEAQSSSEAAQDTAEEESTSDSFTNPF